MREKDDYSIETMDEFSKYESRKRIEALSQGSGISSDVSWLQFFSGLFVFPLVEFPYISFMLLSFLGLDCARKVSIHIFLWPHRIVWVLKFSVNFREDLLFPAIFGIILWLLAIGIFIYVGKSRFYEFLTSGRHQEERSLEKQDSPLYDIFQFF